jgi:hypothetical protein
LSALRTRTLFTAAVAVAVLATSFTAAYAATDTERAGTEHTFIDPVQQPSAGPPVSTGPTAGPTGTTGPSADPSGSTGPSAEPSDPIETPELVCPATDLLSSSLVVGDARFASVQRRFVRVDYIGETIIEVNVNGIPVENQQINSDDDPKKFKKCSVRPGFKKLTAKRTRTGYEFKFDPPLPANCFVTIQIVGTDGRLGTAVGSDLDGSPLKIVDGKLMYEPSAPNKYLITIKCNPVK